ncbi:FKBP-type peptidyl-prolyl cis-trans isomerase [Massilibacteroides sp.]|uniref:FKBP-type peptidyl-prolyl cis-trans isomerase n=1 Tax=Massilibacteroides sp. TaxID=2034766 RepID=UPI00261A41CD|nr:FKBP-type peptidyl-prolyl cis-trans isomerase [Massilibacteroides sp.]MDD4514198.1 FKBP-type peptidyl-prolyl cis-trans isomerase [Massilibacteroides sp.]
MMKKLFYLLAVIACTGAMFSSCSSDDDDDIYIVDDAWQADNERVFNEIAQNPEYKELKSKSNAGSIYYKELEPKSPATLTEEQIFYTSTVKVYYYGMSMDITSRKMEYLFDTSDYPLRDPATFAVSGVVDGFATALQFMHPGERWEIWIPWKLGYGSTGNRDSYSGSSKVPWAYSTLKFEVEVVEIVEE